MAYQMTDVDLMPYGKYKGKQMGNVPPEYLLWLYDNNKCSGNVKAYIEDAMDFIKLEIERNKKNQKS